MAYLCDRCNTRPAGYVVSGLTALAYYDGLCGECCASFLDSKGDKAGADKFRAVIV